MASAQVVETSIAENSPSQITQMIFFHQVMSLLGSTHFLI